MDFIQELNLWTKGDALQGKVMVGLGLIWALALPLLSNKVNTLSNYLDISTIYNPDTGKMKRKHYLELHIYKRPKTE